MPTIKNEQKEIFESLTSSTSHMLINIPILQQLQCPIKWNKPIANLFLMSIVLQSHI